MRMGVPRVARLHAPAYPHPPVRGAGVPHIHIYTNIDSGLPNFTNTTYKNKTIIYNYTPQKFIFTENHFVNTEFCNVR